MCNTCGCGQEAQPETTKEGEEGGGGEEEE